MGNSPSNNSEKKVTSDVNTHQTNNISKQTKLFDGDEAFDKIKFLSNDILEKYQDHFLDKGFCDKIALIYKKKEEGITFFFYFYKNYSLNNKSS